MMFAFEVTKVDHRTGLTQTWRDRKRYRTLQGAQKAAIGWNSVTRPDGKTTTFETIGRVIPM